MTYTPPPECHAIVSAIKQAQSFFLVPHIHIDGDDLGSMLALSYALEAMGKTTYLYSPDKTPEVFAFLPGVERIHKVLPEQHFDAVLLMECPSLNRLPAGVVPAKLATTVINLDHHIGNTTPADYSWVDPSMCALGELAAHLIFELGVPLTPELCTALYVSIASDSGRFQYSTVSARTHQVIAKIIDYVNVEYVSRQMFSKSAKELELLKRMLNVLHVSPDGRIVWADLTAEMLEATGVVEEDTQNLTAELNCVRTGEVFALFKHIQPDKIRISLRSTHAAVNEVARKFGGGGHKQAAACSLTGNDLEVAHKIILGELRQLIDRPADQQDQPQTTIK